MKAHLDSLSFSSCCTNALPTIGSCCPRYAAGSDQAPALIGELADVAEKSIEFLIAKAVSALKTSVPSRM